ncbi:MAG: molybdopterin-dependent oxidoreductase [bacterium]
MKISIDNREIEVSPPITILEAAKQANIKIPTLCYDKRLSPFGACRICIVELEGARERFTTSCTTPVEDGMKIKTTSPEIIKARKTILELILVNHPLDCPVCDKAGECELQNLVYEYGVSSNRFLRFREEVKLRKDYESPLIERDMNRCILCGKCVRVCDELEGKQEISFANRGQRTLITTDFERPLNCDFCGMCLDICPVGALSSKLFKYKKRAWELESKETICPFCNVGCRLITRSKDGVILKVEGGDGINETSMCVKGHFGWDYVYSEKRISEPLIKKDGRLVSASWDEALELIAKKFQGIKGKIALIASSRLTNEELLLAKQFSHSCLESQNIFSLDESFSSFSSLSSSLGYIPSLSPSSIKDSDCILCLSDISESNPVLNTFVHYACKNKEANLISISPIETKITRLSSIKLLTKPGKEEEILFKMQRTMIDENICNWDFIHQKTEGFDYLRETLLKYEPDDKTKEAAKTFAKAKNPVIIASDSSYVIKSACNLLLLLGIPSNIIVCGNRTNSRGAYEIIKNQACDLTSKDIKGLFLLEEILPSLIIKEKEFVVVSHLFMRDEIMEADVILPSSSSLEKDGRYTSLFGITQKIEKVCSFPFGKSQLEILQLLSLKMGCPIEKREEEGGRKEFERGKFWVLEPQETRDNKQEGFDIILSYNHFHSGYISHYSKTLMELSPFPILKMNKNDIKRLNISQRAKIMLEKPIVMKVEEDRNIGEKLAVIMEHPDITSVFYNQPRVFKAMIGSID